jgi:hypothetical protein
MQPREWFELATRLMGLWQLVIAAQYLISAGYFLLEKERPRAPFSDELRSFYEYLYLGIAYAVLGVALLRGARFLTAFSFVVPRDDEQDQAADATEAE